MRQMSRADRWDDTTRELVVIHAQRVIAHYGDRGRAVIHDFNYRDLFGYADDILPGWECKEI